MKTNDAAVDRMPVVTENREASLVLADIAHANLPTYFRSKLFHSNNGINNIVSCAHPLLAIIDRLKLVDSAPSFEAILDNLSHEINAFESKLSTYSYPLETLILARYILTATLDEGLAKCLQRFQQECQFIAFTAISKDGTGPELRFFDILDKALEKPTNNLDLLELIYLCLSAGFEGKFHEQIDGRQLLDDKIEQVYQSINKHRVFKTLDLFKRETKVPQAPVKARKNYLTYAVYATLTIVLSIAINHILVEKKVEQVLSQRVDKLIGEP